ncbi:MAG: M15 family metallopeptidase [Gloeobacteraceae cyanobacterium ES-bin-316]|nr:M15 family metallopeptidase [Ferruginibacter sp.]
MTYDRNPRYLHPYIATNLLAILASINTKLPVGHACKLVSAHRTPDDQFKLFKQGRIFRNGSWVKVGPVVTHLDGFVKKSRHNNLPCTAFDVGIFKGNTYLGDSPLYKHVKQGIEFGLEWGGHWTRFKDMPHLEMPSALFFKNNLEKDQGYVWQRYLQKDGSYTGNMDGIFGTNSINALKNSTGEEQRNLAAWDILFNRHGKIILDF